uniref:Uncharacterized protein n=1 Tax=Setaria italica TaxID=4555 RepID=K4AIC0_SETIT
MELTAMHDSKAATEYQVLYQQRTDIGCERSYSYYILMVGSQQPRSIRGSTSSAPMVEAVSRGLPALSAALVPGAQQHTAVEAEEFRWMRRPMVHNNKFLFETEGRLGLSRCDQRERMVDLWIKQDYDKNGSASFRLSCRMSTVLQRYSNGCYHCVSRARYACGVCEHGAPLRQETQEEDMLVEFVDMVHCNSKGKVLRTFSLGGPFILFT